MRKKEKYIKENTIIVSVNLLNRANMKRKGKEQQHEEERKEGKTRKKEGNEGKQRKERGRKEVPRECLLFMYQEIKEI